jgi:hypothetical protein
MHTIANYRDYDASLQKKFDEIFFRKFWENKTNKEVYRWLDNDNGIIVVSGTTFWIETYGVYCSYPNSKAFESIQRFCKKLGFTYLYSK